jgi:hypothetical protein
MFSLTLLIYRWDWNSSLVKKTSKIWLNPRKNKTQCLALKHETILKYIGSTVKKQKSDVEGCDLDSDGFSLVRYSSSTDLRPTNFFFFLHL